MIQRPAMHPRLCRSSCLSHPAFVSTWQACGVSTLYDIYHHSYASHRYTPKPVMTAAVPVIAARRLAMPNMLLLFRITASWAFNCACPVVYVYAPAPTNTAVPIHSSHQKLVARELRTGNRRYGELTNNATRRAVIVLRPVLLKGFFE